MSAPAPEVPDCSFCEGTRRRATGGPCGWCATGHAAVVAAKPWRSAFPRRHEANAGVCQCCDGLGYWRNTKAGGAKVKCGPCRGTGRYVLPEAKKRGARGRARAGVNLSMAGKRTVPAVQLD